MSVIIQNKIIRIVGKPWQGKSIFSFFLASFYPRIYSNIDYYRNGKKINTTIQNLWDVESIKYSDEKGVVVLEEWGVNINARKSMSDANFEFAKLGMLWRKKNVDIIVISQLDRMVDVYFRELAYYTFKMRAYYSKKDYLMFEARVVGEHDNHLKILEFDLFEWMKVYGYSYDSKESSEMDLKKIKKEEKALSIA